MILTDDGKTKIRDVILGLSTNLASANVHSGAGHQWDSGAVEEYPDLDETATMIEHDSPAVNTEIHDDITYYRAGTPNISYPTTSKVAWLFTFGDSQLPSSSGDNLKIVREFGFLDASPKDTGTLIGADNKNAIQKVPNADILYEITGVIQ